MKKQGQCERRTRVSVREYGVRLSISEHSLIKNFKSSLRGMSFCTLLCWERLENDLKEQLILLHKNL